MRGRRWEEGREEIIVNIYHTGLCLACIISFNPQHNPLKGVVINTCGNGNSVIKSLSSGYAVSREQCQFIRLQVLCSEPSDHTASL